MTQFFAILIFTLTPIIATSQSDSLEPTLKSPLVKGDNILNFGVGFPNFYKNYNNGGVGSGIGPFAMRFEHLLTNSLAIGVDVAYQTGTRIGGAFFSEFYLYEDDTIKKTKIGVILTLTEHFVIADKLDFYITGGIGYKHRRILVNSDSDYDFDDEFLFPVIPIAFRFVGGARYYFNANFGIRAEVGFGQGGAMQTGLMFKF